MIICHFPALWWFTSTFWLIKIHSFSLRLNWVVLGVSATWEADWLNRFVAKTGNGHSLGLHEVSMRGFMGIKPTA
jgi:hypothetical protein